MVRKDNIKVGFLGFGEVASNLSKWLTQGGVEVYTSLDKRSLKTKNRAQEYAVNTCPDYRTLAEISDILISTVTPAESVNVAKEVGKYVAGIYVDINNISPKTTMKALSYVENGKTADAAIMGGIKKEGRKVAIIASGKYSHQFSELNKYGLNIQVINQNTGQAKALKMLRSSYTKGVSALLFESLYSAYKLGLDQELLEYLQRTEGPQFRKSAISRIENGALHSKRKEQEMQEVIDFIQEFTQPIMSKSTKAIFKHISNKIEPDKRPKDYKQLFEAIK